MSTGFFRHFLFPQGIKSHLFDSFIIFIIGHILRLLPAPLTDLTDGAGICGMQHYLICPFRGRSERSFMCYLWRLALLCRFMCSFGDSKGVDVVGAPLLPSSTLSPFQSMRWLACPSACLPFRVLKLFIRHILRQLSSLRDMYNIILRWFLCPRWTGQQQMSIWSRSPLGSHKLWALLLTHESNQSESKYPV